MDLENKILVTANIRFIKSKPMKLSLLIYYILTIGIMILGFKTDRWGTYYWYDIDISWCIYIEDSPTAYWWLFAFFLLIVFIPFLFRKVKEKINRLKENDFSKVILTKKMLFPAIYYTLFFLMLWLKPIIKLLWTLFDIRFASLYDQHPVLYYLFAERISVWTTSNTEMWIIVLKIALCVFLILLPPIVQGIKIRKSKKPFTPKLFFQDKIKRRKAIHYLAYYLSTLPFLAFIYDEVWQFYNFRVFNWLLFSFHNDESHLWLCVSVFLIILIFPIFLCHLHIFECKSTSLTVAEDRVFGSYSGFLTKKKLEMPIEKIDSVSVFSGFFDFLRSGKTLCIASGASSIRIHFVQNADEVATIAMERIYKGKDEEKTVKESEPVVANNNGTVKEKLMTLNELKQSGLITEDEYNKKKEDLLSKL